MKSAATLAFIVLVFIAVSWASAYAFAAISSRLPARLCTRIRAALALGPIVLGALAALALLAPELSSAGCHCGSHAPHHPHVCLSHPGVSWPMVASVVLVLVWFARVAPALLQLMRDAFQTARWSERASASPRATETAVHLVRGVGARVMTVGILKPIVAADPTVWRGLRAGERRAISFHEHAHALRRDGLTLLCLRFAAALMPQEPARRLVAAWKTAAEIACDRFAAVKTGDPCLVAEALVQCGRLQMARVDVPPPGLALAATNDDDLEVRVKALLAMPTTVTRTQTGNDAGRIGPLFIALAVALAITPGDATHHAVETFLGWLV